MICNPYCLVKNLHLEKLQRHHFANEFIIYKHYKVVLESTSYFWINIKDSRHFQLAIYIYIYVCVRIFFPVFHAESESAVRIYQFLHPEEKIKKNQPTRVSISYRKISYHNSSPRTL